MSWKRGLLAALAVCALLGGPAGCGSGDGPGRGERVSASPVGTLLDGTDEGGRHYREVDQKNGPEVAIEVLPDPRGGWDVHLSVRHFRFSPAGAGARAVAGHGVARLYVDGRAVATLRTARHHLAGDLVPRGTHHVTARLYADDRTVWAVRGKPVESTADITASVSPPTHGAAATRTPAGASAYRAVRRGAPATAPGAVPVTARTATPVTAPGIAPVAAAGAADAVAPAVASAPVGAVAKNPATTPAPARPAGADGGGGTAGTGGRGSPDSGGRAS
ncbi:nuclear transport factor 2 family protein [Streptomyces sp. NPDC004324]